MKAEIEDSCNAWRPCQQNPDRHPISCDVVALLLNLADRYIAQSKYPSVSQQREMQKYAMLYEIMDIAGLRFEDDKAIWNGTPNQVRDYNK